MQRRCVQPSTKSSTKGSRLAKLGYQAESAAIREMATFDNAAATQYEAEGVL